MGQILERQLADVSWLKHCPAGQWLIYKEIMKRADDRGLRFAVGGAFAIMAYTRHWRDTKDIDLFVLKRDKDQMIRLLTDCGLRDYYEREEYQRHWIYRGYNEAVIVDVIWEMANQRAVVDETWLQGPQIEARGERFRLVPVEETLWSQLYVLQPERCDWPDALNLLYALGPELNWPHLVDRLREDVPLLSALLCIFGWLSPDRALELPDWIWDKIHARRPETGLPLPEGGNRARFIDSRPWFAPTLSDECSEQNPNDSSEATRC